MERGTYANARDAVSALHGRRAKPLRDYRLLRQSSRDFETVIWPRNLRKCRRWLEFSDKRDGPWRDKEREAKGMRERGVGGAKVGRGGRGYNAQENVEGGRGNDGNGNYFPFSARNCSTHGR